MMNLAGCKLASWIKSAHEEYSLVWLFLRVRDIVLELGLKHRIANCCQKLLPTSDDQRYRDYCPPNVDVREPWPTGHADGSFCSHLPREATLNLDTTHLERKGWRVQAAAVFERPRPAFPLTPRWLPACSCHLLQCSTVLKM